MPSLFRASGPSELASGATRKISDNTRSALLMILSTAAFVANDAIMKYVTQSLPVYQSILTRCLFLLPLLVGFALMQGGLRLRLARRDLPALCLRSIGEIGSTMLYLLALQHMALGNLSAIMQAMPLLVTLAAAIVFRDRLGPRRLIAIAIGFIGVLIIVRPGSDAFDGWSLVALAAVLMVVLRDLATRSFSSAVPSVTIAIYAAVAVMIFSLILTTQEVWVMPQLNQIALLALAAILFAVGAITVVATMRLGEISFVAPFRYTALIWAILLGWLIFGEWPDVWTQLGALLIVAAGLYAIWREGRAARR
ncbi:DMT family transporter [Paracoccus sp. (in: a-proteobacteria)]|uniref:DMT family transporter n=1 Tax=Paracoccus sp. TaxID=267 RepID=UPI00289907A8|nr:DMT family transporter [Paracoccus sp. (in: a-proteobacteria)]